MSSLCNVLLAALILAPAVAGADQEITLDLTPSRAPAAQAAPAPGPGGAAAPAVNRRAPNRRTIKEKVLGRLGVTSRTVTIRAARTPGARRLVNVAGGTYMALTREAGDWFGVLMADRSIGWLPKNSVNVLAYEVVGPDQPATGTRGPDFRTALLSTGQRALLQTAYTYLGVPYKWGGTSPNGLDCSAFVQRCFATMGLSLPRTAAEQFSCGLPVSLEQLQAADRVYFASRNGRITHTGIYVGDGYFIHSSSSQHGVAVNRLSEPMYSRMFAGARR